MDWWTSITAWFLAFLGLAATDAQQTACLVSRPGPDTVREVLAPDGGVTLKGRRFVIPGDVGTLVVEDSHTLQFTAKDGRVSTDVLRTGRVPLYETAAADRFGNFVIRGSFLAVYIGTANDGNSSVRLDGVHRFPNLHTGDCSTGFWRMFSNEDCYAASLFYSDTLRMAFFRGIDPAGEQATYVLREGGPVLLEHNGVRLHAYTDVPSNPLTVLRDAYHNLYFYDGVTAVDMRVRLAGDAKIGDQIGNAKRYYSWAAGELFLRDREKLVRIRGRDVEVVVFPESTYGDYRKYRSLAGDDVILGINSDRIGVIRDGRFAGSAMLDNIDGLQGFQVWDEPDVAAERNGLILEVARRKNDGTDASEDRMRRYVILSPCEPVDSPTR